MHQWDAHCESELHLLWRAHPSAVHQPDAHAESEVHDPPFGIFLDGVLDAPLPLPWPVAVLLPLSFAGVAGLAGAVTGAAAPAGASQPA